MMSRKVREKSGGSYLAKGALILQGYSTPGSTGPRLSPEGKHRDGSEEALPQINTALAGVGVTSSPGRNPCSPSPLALLTTAHPSFLDVIALTFRGPLKKISASFAFTLLHSLQPCEDGEVRA